MMRILVADDASEAQIAALISIIETRGITQDEFDGFMRALRSTSVPVDFGDLAIIDVCGTGGDGKNTFNISTASAFVLAGSGINVAKHGNQSASSACGSSDVLACVGVRFTDNQKFLKRQIADAGIAYLHAPLFQPALRRIAAVRRSLGFRTFFNVLGPLLNPARPTYRFAGVSSPRFLRQYRYFLESEAGTFAVVHTRDGYDEIALTAAFDVATRDGIRTYSPEDIGISRVHPHDLRGGEDAASAAEILLNLLEGRGTDAQRNIVIVNAAFARQAVTEEPLQLCIDLCRSSLESGLALRALKRLIAISNEEN